MFKLTLVLVAVLGLSAGGMVPVARNEPGVLDAVLAECTESIDTDQVAVILLSYLFDPEFQTAMQFLFGPEFAGLYLELSESPEVAPFLEFLGENGFSWQIYSSLIRAFLGLPPRDLTGRQARNGIAGLVEELLGVLPLEDLRACADYHVENTPEFAALYERMQSDEFAAVMRKWQQHPVVVNIEERLLEWGVDLNRIIDLINEALGWGLVPVHLAAAGTKLMA